MNIDEAEALLWAQEFSWGYGPQPPLYIWLQGVIFYVTGASVVGLALLKAGLLFGIFFVAQGLSSRWVQTAGVPYWFAGAAAAMLFWIPEFAWESQRIRTHNVVASLIALLAMWQALRLRDTPSHFNHALLGILLGLGLLSKWNFVILALAMIVVLSSERKRRALHTMAATWLLLVPCLMVVPTILWIAGHSSVALASYHKLGILADMPWYAAAGEWVFSYLRALLSFGGLALLVFGGGAVLAHVYRTERLIPSETARDEISFVVRVSALALVLLLAGGALKGATVLQARWLLPLLAPGVPAMAFLLLARLPDRFRRRLIQVTLVVPLIVIAGMVVLHMTERPYRYFNGSLVAPLLPLNDDLSPYLASVRMAAHLKLVQPDRVLKDEALLMAGRCPDSVTVLEPAIARGARVSAWLAGCGLVEEVLPRTPPEGPAEADIPIFVRR